MDMQSVSSVPVYLTSCLNDKVLGERIKCWQVANVGYIKDKIMFESEGKAEYESLMKDLSQCFIAFIGCNKILSKIPNNEEALQQELESNGKLGKWCLWHIDAHYIELIAERLMSMRSDAISQQNDIDAAYSDKLEAKSNGKFIPQDNRKPPFNPCDLITFKIPQQSIGENVELRPWMCGDNIAQIRNQESANDTMILTALANQHRNEDTAAEFSKIQEEELQVFDADNVISFAECYGIDLNSSGKFYLSDDDKQCLNSVLTILREELSLGLYSLASYVAALLINYRIIEDDNLSDSRVRTALGQALHTLGIPRNSDIFIGRAYAQGSQKAYKNALCDIFKLQGGFENRRSDDDNALNWAGMEKCYQKLCKEASNRGVGNDYLRTHELEVVRKFLNAAQSPADEYALCYHDLCLIDWPGKLERLFDSDNKPTKKAKLSERTRACFEKQDFAAWEDVKAQVIAETQMEGQEEEAKRIWLQEHSILEELDKEVLALADRRQSNLQEEERSQLDDFFNTYRSVLITEPNLYMDWEKIICQQKITCTDFSVGLSQILLSLNSEHHDLISISLCLEKFKSPKEFLGSHNLAMCEFFSIMYSPLLRKLQDDFPQKFFVKVERKEGIPHPLLEFPQFFSYCKEHFGDANIECTKEAKQMLQLGFKVVMQLRGDNGKNITNTGSLTWSMDKNSVGLKLHHDLLLIAEAKAPLSCSFSLNSMLVLAERQKLSLNDIFGFMSNAVLQPGAFIQDDVNDDQDNFGQNGSSISNEHIGDTANQEYNVLKQFHNVCDKQANDSNDDWDSSYFFDEDYLSSDLESIQQEFEELCQLYVQTIESMLQGKITFSQVSFLYDQYYLMQLHIMQKLEKDELRINLLTVVQSIGLAYEANKNLPDFAVATPYNIHSLYQHMLRLKRIYNLVDKMLQQRMVVMKHKYLMEVLAHTQKQPYGPEVLPPKEINGVVLQAVQGVYGYTLYQKKVSLSNIVVDNFSNQSIAELNYEDLFDIDEQVDQVLNYLQFYVIKHPQVRELFNVLIFNCSDLTVIRNIYTRLSESEFFKQVNVRLYVIHENQSLLSSLYHDFEIKEQTVLDEADFQEGANIPKLILLSKQQASELNQKLTLNQPAYYGVEADGQSAQKTNRASKGMFDVGVLLHVCDSYSSFDFIVQNVPLAQRETELFYPSINFANYQFNKKLSSLFLASAEQNLGGLIYLQTVYFLTTRKIDTNSLDMLEEVIKARKENDEDNAALQLSCDLNLLPQGTSDVQVKTFLTYVPSFQLLHDQDSQSFKTIQYVQGISKDVLILDRILTKQQTGKRVFKYQHLAHTNTNLYIATNLNDGVLRKKLSSLLSEINEPELNNLESIRKIFNYALSLSGGIIQHAMLNDNCTSEMLGLVLSMFVGQLIAKNLNKNFPLVALNQPTLSVNEGANYEPVSINNLPKNSFIESNSACFMLDEYDSWFGSKTGERSDILLLNLVRKANNRHLLRILVIESKFVKDSVRSAANKSLKQSQAAAESFFELFSPDNSRFTVDRQLCLRQLGIMISQNMDREDQKLLKFQQALSLGNIDVALTAISCVYGYQDRKQSEAVKIELFDYGNKDKSSSAHKPCGKGVQLRFRADSVKHLLRSMLLKPNLGMLNDMLFNQQEMQEFMSKQMIVALDAAPSKKEKFTADSVSS